MIHTKEETVVQCFHGFLMACWAFMLNGIGFVCIQNILNTLSEVESGENVENI